MDKNSSMIYSNDINVWCSDGTNEFDAKQCLISTLAHLWLANIVVVKITNPVRPFFVQHAAKPNRFRYHSTLRFC